MSHLSNEPATPLQKKCGKKIEKGLTTAWISGNITFALIQCKDARVVELADSLDSGSSVHYARAGSSPASRTKTKGHPKGCPFVLGSVRRGRPTPFGNSNARRKHPQGVRHIRRAAKPLFRERLHGGRGSFSCEKVTPSTMKSVISKAHPRGALSCPCGAIHLVSLEMTDFDLIPAAAAAGTLRGFPSERVFRQPEPPICQTVCHTV